MTKLIECKENYACVIDNKLYFGNKIPAIKDDELYQKGIRAIVCLLPKDKQINHDRNKFTVLNIETDDKVTCQLTNWAETTSNFIQENIDNNEPIYVHCSKGVSRSTSCIIHYLMTKTGKNLKDSFLELKAKRSVISPTMGFFRNLLEVELRLFGKNSISEEEYALMMLKESFPGVEINDIKNIYDKYKELYTTGNKKEEYNSEMEKNNYEPIGYHTVEELLNGIGKGKFIPRKGASVHHPFD